MTDSLLRTLTRDQAYELYRAMSPRSLTVLSEKTGIPRGSLCRWSADEHWADRIKREQSDLFRGIRDAADAWLLAGLPDTLRRIEAMIADDTSAYDIIGGMTVCTHQATPPAVRAKLLVWRAELAGLVPSIGPSTEDDPLDDAVDYDRLSVTELAALVRARREQR